MLHPAGRLFGRPPRNDDRVGCKRRPASRPTRLAKSAERRGGAACCWKRPCAQRMRRRALLAADLRAAPARASFLDESRSAASAGGGFDQRHAARHGTASSAYRLVVQREAARGGRTRVRSDELGRIGQASPSRRRAGSGRTSLKQSVSQVAQLSTSRVQRSICAGVSEARIADISGEHPRLIDARRPEPLGKRSIAAEALSRPSGSPPSARRSRARRWRCRNGSGRRGCAPRPSASSAASASAVRAVTAQLKLKSTLAGSSRPSKARRSRVGAVAVDPMQEEVGGPGIGIGRGAAVAVVDALVEHGVADPHRDRRRRCSAPKSSSTLALGSARSRADSRSQTLPSL